MVCLTIYDSENPQSLTKTSEPDEISNFLRRYGMTYEHWGIRCGEESGQEAILRQYEVEIEKLKASGGYLTADVIDVNPETPGLDAMLDRFKVEHTHDEDEVRFVVRGGGIFHIHGDDGVVFAVEMHPGDLITVPRGTRHWFNLCKEKTIQTIRLFQDQSGWTPHYVDREVHRRYEPLCFGPAYLHQAENSTSIDAAGKHKTR